MSKALFITHADAGVGGGHLSRSFALSEGLAAFGVASSWILNEESAEQAASFGLEDVLFLPDPFTSDIPMTVSRLSRTPICTPIPPNLP